MGSVLPKGTGPSSPIRPAASACTHNKAECARIALRDILFELTEFKARHDHDLHELKAIVRRREAEAGRLADAIQLLRDLQATLSTPLMPVAGAVACGFGGFIAKGDGCAEAPSQGFTNGDGI